MGNHTRLSQLQSVVTRFALQRSVVAPERDCQGFWGQKRDAENAEEKQRERGGTLILPVPSSSDAVGRAPHKGPAFSELSLLVLCVLCVPLLAAHRPELQREAAVGDGNGPNTGPACAASQAIAA